MKSELRALKEREAMKVLFGAIIRWLIIAAVIIGLFISSLAIWYYCTESDVLYFLATYIMFGLVADCIIIGLGNKWVKNYIHKMSKVIDTKVKIFKLRNM